MLALQQLVQLCIIVTAHNTSDTLTEPSVSSRRPSMSTLKVTNIQATGETASRAVSGVAAAWVNFNGTSTMLSEIAKTSRVYDNGTGDIHVNSATICSTQTTASLGHRGIGLRNAMSLRVSIELRSRITVGDIASSKEDSDMHSAIHGDLA